MEAVADPDSLIKVNKIRDFAFINFSNREDAKKCLDYWNGK